MLVNGQVALEKNLVGGGIHLRPVGKHFQPGVRNDADLRSAFKDERLAIVDIVERAVVGDFQIGGHLRHHGTGKQVSGAFRPVFLLPVSGRRSARSVFHSRFRNQGHTQGDQRRRAP